MNKCGPFASYLIGPVSNHGWSTGAYYDFGIIIIREILLVLVVLVVNELVMDVMDYLLIVGIRTVDGILELMKILVYKHASRLYVSKWWL